MFCLESTAGEKPSVTGYFFGKSHFGDKMNGQKLANDGAREMAWGGEKRERGGIVSAEA